MSKNLLDLYTEYATEGTDAPSKYHRYCAAALISTILGRRAWFQLGHTTIFPSLWVCLIGPSSLAKKSTSANIALNLIARFDRELILPGKTTTEGLYRVCSDKEKPEAKRGTGVMFYGELQSLITQFARDYNTELKSTLTDWYDSPDCRSYSSMAAGTISVIRPAMTFLAASTPDWLIEAAQSRDIRGGFYPRWLFAIADKSDQPPKPLPKPRDEQKAARILSMIKERLANFQYEYSDGSPHGQFKMTDSGEKEYCSIYGQMRERFYSDDMLGSFAGRANVQTLKLAMVYAFATTGGTGLDAEAIRWGHEMAVQSIVDVATLCSMIGDSKTEVNLNKLHRFIREAGPDGASKTTIMQKCRGFQSAMYLDKLLKDLIAAERILMLPIKRQQGQRGKLPEIYVARDFDIKLPPPQEGADDAA